MKIWLCVVLGLLATAIGGKADLEPECTNETKVEITFVLDGSSSIGYGGFMWKLKNTVNGIIDYMLPGPVDSVQNNSRVAVIVFSTNSTLQWNLGTYKTKKELQKAIDAIKYPARQTAIGDALHDALTLVHPNVRPGLKHLVILITDGESDAGTYNETVEAKKLKDAGAKLYVIAVGNQVNKNILDQMASGPEYRVDASDYDILLENMKNTSTLICEEAVKTTPAMQPTAPPTPPPCTPDTKVDISFVLDSSGSIGKDNYNNGLKPAVKGIINKMLPGDANTPANSRVAAIVYSETSVLHWNLDKYTTKNQLLQAVDALPYYNDVTATGDGLHDALTLVHPIVRAGVKHLVILITDGESNWGNYKDTEEAEKLKNAGASVFVVSVGNQIIKSILDKIASGPEYRADVSSYTDLLSKMTNLSIMTCKQAAVI